READFLEPEPVGVERHRLAPAGQDEEGEEKPEADAGTPRVPDRPRAATSHARFSAASQPAAEKGPAAMRRPRAAREAYSLYVPLGGGLRPPSEASPQESLRRRSRRSEVKNFHVERRAPDEDSHGPPVNGPLRARVSSARDSPGG